MGHNRDTQIVKWFLVRCDILIIRCALLDGNEQVEIVLLQLGAEGFRFVLFFVQVLKSNKAEHDCPRVGNELQKESFVKREFNRGSHSQNLIG